MTYEELIEEAGAAIGIDGFTPDDDGVCMLVSVREKLESAGDKLAEGKLPDFGEFIRV